jgi:hypothetical protein
MKPIVVVRGAEGINPDGYLAYIRGMTGRARISRLR